MRFAGFGDAGDQARVMTPEKARELGWSDYIVVGRPITQAEDPVAAYRALREGIPWRVTKEERPWHWKRQIARDAIVHRRGVSQRPEEPFTWASGIKSPVYCDNRLTLTAPAGARLDVENGLDGNYPP